MEVTELRKIHEGMSGIEAANVIYNNDRKLYEAIDDCALELENNKVIVAEANIDGVSTPVTIAQTTGTSTSEVISQKGVTLEINTIQAEISGMCGVTEDEYETINISADTLTNARIADMAATDLNGRSISGMFDLFVAYMETANATIADLEARIAELEAELENN